MSNKQQPSVSFNVHSKDTPYRSQKQDIFCFLHTRIATARMVSYATWIPITSITRIKHDLELAGLLWEVEKNYCKKTGNKAWYLTTDPKKAPSHPLQLSLSF